MRLPRPPYIPRSAMCAECGEEFEKRAPAHFYCGSMKTRSGCAYKRYLLKIKEHTERELEKLRKEAA